MGADRASCAPPCVSHRAMRYGSGPDAVLDHELTVRGLDGLRGADSSSMPDIPGGNTQAPVIVLAEKSSDLIAGYKRPAAADLPTLVRQSV